MPGPVQSEELIVECAREPIHLLGAIQPIGFLISVTDRWFCARASENTSRYLGLTADEVVDRPASSYIPGDVLHDIRGRLQTSAGPGVVERLFGRRLTADGPPFDIAIHRSGDEIVLECEHAQSKHGSDLAELSAMIGRVARHQTSEDSLCREAARQIFAMTGFDRVMVYRFDEDAAGEVIAEHTRSGLTSFLGLRYPASDIPPQARALYERNLVRIIADVDAAPVPIRPSLSPKGAPLDLSMSVLRSVSPVHIEYLRNMGVRASMSISILVRGKLWGLIACHHMEPYHVHQAARATAELFGQMFSYLLESRINAVESAFDARARDIQQGFAAAFAAPSFELTDIPSYLANVPNYIPADGICVYYAGKVGLSGSTPLPGEIQLLIDFLDKIQPQDVLFTHHLCEIFPTATSFTNCAGILSIPFSKSPRGYLVFFRREVARTVTWAGEPSKSVTIGPDGQRLTPRKSFEAWREIVRDQSQRWKPREVRAAAMLRLPLVELLLRASESAQAQQAHASQRDELLIAELNHRVRNLLGLVRGLITKSAVSVDDVRTLVERLDNRIRSLARAHDLLTSSNWKEASLHDLLCAELATYVDVDDRVAFVGPDVLVDPSAFSTMALVLHELVTNARKYGAISTEKGAITIQTVSHADGNVALRWEESGGPAVTAPTRRGFGTTILEQAIPFELKGKCESHYPSSGYRLDMVLPAAIARCDPNIRSRRSAMHPHGRAIDADALAPLLRTFLVVEDNLFIAIDVEDMLRRLGAKQVIIARSVPEALANLAQREITAALLDLNLGRENSLPIAQALRSATIPFAFGTGYGEAYAFPDAFKDVPVLPKPYHRAALAKILDQLRENAADMDAKGSRGPQH